MGEYLLKCFLALLFLLLHMESIEGGETLCRHNERKALLTFKHGLKDDYGMLSSWKDHQNVECCQWKGVRCNNKTGHVETLYLRGRIKVFTDLDASASIRIRYGLKGLINHSLIELSYLTHLDLSLNDFNSAPIPDFIGHLSNLRHLNLSNACFVGKLPHQFGFLQLLKYLDLSQNDLEGAIPSQLGNLSHLMYLDLSYSNLVGEIPSQFGNLSNLQLLMLSGNYDLEFHDDMEWVSRLSSLMHLDLSGMPKLNHSNNLLQNIGQLPNLKELKLAQCELSDANLVWLSQTNSNFTSSLSILDLSQNNLASSTIFMWVSNFSFNLHKLLLPYNILEGPIPVGFGNIVRSLEYLDLSYNKLKGAIPNSFGNMCNMMYLDLSYNNLEGAIPNSFGNMCNLISLNLSNNLLSGKLSGLVPSTSKCSHVQHPLQYLNLEHNQISGTIPELSMFSSLKTLSIFENRLHGNIPKSTGLLSKLEYFHLEGNSLDGLMTESHFSTLSQLKELDLSNNSLAMKFHRNWVAPFQLVSLNLASCRFVSGFPKWLQTQKDLEHLDISNAGISDTVPQQFWNVLSNMRYLNMSYNNLRGTIPTNLSFNLTDKIQKIDLESNNFNGSIPPSFLQVVELRLSKNQFSGFGWFLCDNNITVKYSGPLGLLDASSNQLIGQLPDCWHHFTTLMILDLSNNKLSGKIPASIGNLVHVTVLSLRNNSLTGELPSSLSNCTELQMLDVGENHLSGPIPSWVGESLQQLVILSIRGNDFYGLLPLHVCYLEKIQLLDASENNIIGKIPACIENFTIMTHENDDHEKSYFSTGLSKTHAPMSFNYDLNAYLTWKGVKYIFKNPESRLNSIDFSSNQFTGEMPKEIGNLIGLISLNLSRNRLSGEITPKLGNLKSLEFLDLSRNQFTGKIPSSLAGIDRLTGIDVSNNNLSGKIPIGTQLQSFPMSSYENNSGLCGKPLDIICPEDEARVPIQAPNSEENGNSDFWEALYMSLGIGFATGFWGFLGLTMLKRSWRCAYCRFLQHLVDKIYVLIVVNWRKYHHG